MVGFKLGQDADGNFSENRSLSVLQKYASEIGLDKKTGIEITESAPHVSDSYAVPSYIGQGTNAYTTSQLARYATAIATSGNVYHPNHGMFVGYAPASDPEYAIAVRIENGYASGNACLAADDIFKYIFELTDEKSILTGVAASDTSDTSND